MKHLDFKFNATTTDKIFETDSTFSCEIAHYRKSSIYAFKKSLASIDNFFFFAREGGGGSWALGYISMRF